MFSYRIKVRKSGAVWGGDGVVNDLEHQLWLSLQNDEDGEPIDIVSKSSANGETSIGKLEPGEVLTISLKGVSAIVCSCDFDSRVNCLIHDFN